MGAMKAGTSQSFELLEFKITVCFFQLPYYRGLTNESFLLKVDSIRVTRNQVVGCPILHNLGDS